MALFKAYATGEEEEWHDNLKDEQQINDRISEQTRLDETVDNLKTSDQVPDTDLFFIDSKGSTDSSLDILNATVHRNSSETHDSSKNSKSKKKIKRYTKRKNLDTKPKSFDLDIELKYLHSQLLHNENDIDLWKQFINSQEKNISVGNLKAITERQISIIEEALKKNPGNSDLYELWFKCNKKIYPHNDLTKIIIDRTEKDAGNFQLWLALIDCTQQSISECNVTVVLDLYRKAMTSFKKYRHQNILNRGVLFKLFQRISIFLRQTGSWKELIYFLEYTIWLNCSDCDLSQIFKFPEISNSVLIELEEAVLQSGLPLSEIWFRIESLRETFSWSTVKSDFNNMACNLTIEEMDDLTTVFSEDITKFHLFLHVLSVLRIPILQKDYTFHEILGLNEISWHLDSCEHIIYAFYDAYDKNTGIMQILYEMLSIVIDGPQYWGPRPFITDYSEFVICLIKNFMDYSKDEETKVAFGLLYIRFISLQITLMKHAKKNNQIKNIKKKVKTLLSENNNLKSSILLYIEYAKLESSISDISTGLKTLQVLLQSTNNEISEYPYLVKTYMEFSLLENNKQVDKKHYLNILSQLVHNKSFNENDIPTLIMKYYDMPYSSQLDNVTPALLVPSPQENFICCGAYFIYFTLGVEKAIDYINKMIEDKHVLVKEGLYEWVASLSYYNPEEKILHEFLRNAILKNPNNSKLILAYINLPMQWSAKKTTLSRSILGVILLLCFAKLKVIEAIDETEKIAYKNRQSSILSDAMNDETIMQYPLIWKIYLQYLYENGSNKIMDIMTQAIENFPWMKALYVSGVRYVPQEHSAFQDIIAEKELTLLALTEELEILRQDNPD